MKKKLVLFLVVFSLVISCAFCSGIASAMVSHASSVVLPVDRVLGPLVEPSSSSDHVFLSSVLSQPYSFSWLEENFDSSIRSTVASVYGSFFSSCLPVVGPLFSALHENSDGSVTIGVRIAERVFDFVLSGSRIIAVKEL